MRNENQDWQVLARRASEETNTEKLMDLIRELNSVLEKNEVRRNSSANLNIPSSKETAS